MHDRAIWCWKIKAASCAALDCGLGDRTEASMSACVVRPNSRIPGRICFDPSAWYVELLTSESCARRREKNHFSFLYNLLETLVRSCPAHLLQRCSSTKRQTISAPDLRLSGKKEEKIISNWFLCGEGGGPPIFLLTGSHRLSTLRRSFKKSLFWWRIFFNLLRKFNPLADLSSAPHLSLSSSASSRSGVQSWFDNFE